MYRMTAQSKTDAYRENSRPAQTHASRSKTERFDNITASTHAAVNVYLHLLKGKVRLAHSWDWA